MHDAVRTEEDVVYGVAGVRHGCRTSRSGKAGTRALAVTFVTENGWPAAGDSPNTKAAVPRVNTRRPARVSWARPVSRRLSSGSR